MKLAFTISFVVHMTVLLSTLASGQPPADQRLAERSEAQRNAVKRILPLGGDWEFPSKTILIGFVGDKFSNETFSLLEPLTDLKHLLFSSIPADDTAFAHCKKLTNVEWLQINGCKFDGTGLRHLSGCRKLRVVYIDETPITDAALKTLANHPSIETLCIEHFDIPSRITRTGVLELAALKNARQIYIDMAEDPADLEAEMKALLPNCEFSFTHRLTNHE